MSSPAFREGGDRVDPVALRSRVTTLSPTSGDNSVDRRMRTGGRTVVDRWTTGVHPGDRSGVRGSIHRPARPPTVGPEVGHTARHTAGPGTTGTIHTIHRCEYYCCCSLLEELQEKQACGPSRSGRPERVVHRDDTRPRQALRWSSRRRPEPADPSQRRRSPTAGAPVTDPPVPARERCPP